MAANGLNVVAVRIEDKCPVVVRMIVGPKPWLAVVAPARADSRCVKAVHGSAIRNRKSLDHHNTDPKPFVWDQIRGRNPRKSHPRAKRTRTASFRESSVKSATLVQASPRNAANNSRA